MRCSCGKKHLKKPPGVAATLGIFLFALMLHAAGLSQQQTECDSLYSSDQKHSHDKKQSLLSLPIRFYRKFISPQDIPVCTFEPTCSRFALDALRERGTVAGSLLMIDRIQRCHIGAVVSPQYRKDMQGKSLDGIHLYLPGDSTRACSLHCACSSVDIVDILRDYLRPIPTGYGFAEYLFSLGEFSGAADEYHHHCTEQRGNHDTLLYNTALCRFLADDDSGALRLTTSFLKYAPASYSVQKSILLTAIILYSNNDFDEAGSILNDRFFTCDSLRQLATTLVRLSSAGEFNWSECGTFETDCATDTLLKNINTTVSEYAAAAATLPRRNRMLSSTLSAIVPGAGKVYSGNPVDGFFSFISVITPLALGGWSYHKNREVTFSNAGLVTFSFLLYSADIYGSWFAAQRYNIYRQRKHYESFRQDITADVGLHR
jgi:uncharacterized protein